MRDSVSGRTRRDVAGTQMLDEKGEREKEGKKTHRHTDGDTFVQLHGTIHDTVRDVSGPLS